MSLDMHCESDHPLPGFVEGSRGPLLLRGIVLLPDKRIPDRPISSVEAFLVLFKLLRLRQAEGLTHRVEVGPLL